MANNIKRLRLGFLFTQVEFARLIGVYPEYLPRLEAGDRPLSDVWIDAVSHALGVPPEAVLDPDVDIPALISRTPRPEAARAAVCPLGARYGILALVAKVGGLQLAEEIAEDDLADAVGNLIAYVDNGEARRKDGGLDEAASSRLLKGLQITALAILQSGFDDPPPDFQERLTAALPGAVSLIEAFSHAGETVPAPEME